MNASGMKHTEIPEDRIILRLRIICDEKIDTLAVYITQLKLRITILVSYRVL